MKTMRNKNVAQFRINDRFTLSLSDILTDGLKFEAVLIDNDSSEDSELVSINPETNKKIRLVDLPEVWDFRDLKRVMTQAIEEANKIIETEALKKALFIKL